MKNNKKIITVIIFVLIIVVVPAAAILARLFFMPAEKPYLGSFTLDRAYSYDGKYYADIDHSGDMIKIKVFNADDNKNVCTIDSERRLDFWGICWENDSYDLWTQSADVGLIRYKYESGIWAKDPEAIRPPEIVSKWENYSDMPSASYDKKYYIERAKRIDFDTYEIGVYDMETKEQAYLFQTDENKSFEGMRWAESGYIILIKYDDSEERIEYKDGKWQRAFAENNNE